MPCELSENVKMFQFEASKHKMGRGFQTQDNERFVHFRSEPSLTLFQNLFISELHFKSYSSLNPKSESMIYNTEMISGIYETVVANIFDTIQT